MPHPRQSQVYTLFVFYAYDLPIVVFVNTYDVNIRFAIQPVIIITVVIILSAIRPCGLLSSPAFFRMVCLQEFFLGEAGKTCLLFRYWQSTGLFGFLSFH